jgi:hypothetical protein
MKVYILLLKADRRRNSSVIPIIWANGGENLENQKLPCLTPTGCFRQHVTVVI